MFRNRLRFPFLNPNPVNEPSNQNELAIQNEIRNPKQLDLNDTSEDGPRAPFPSRPPTPLYGMRMKIRTYSPCTKNEAVCDSLPVVACGGERLTIWFSKRHQECLMT